MENRILNQEEKIRRAEEIYYRRKNINGNREGYTTLNVGNKKDYKLFKRMTIQIISCLLIYLAFYTIQNSNYIFSEQIISRAKEILAYDINFEELKNNVVNYINELNLNIKNIDKKDVAGESENEKKETNILEENQTLEENPKQEENQEAGQNPAIEEQNPVLGVTESVLYKEDASSVSQVEQDADYIKNNYSFIKPLQRKYII